MYTPEHLHDTASIETLGNFPARAALMSIGLLSASVTVGSWLAVHPTMDLNNLNLTLQQIAGGVTAVGALGAVLIKARNHVRKVTASLDKLLVLPQQMETMQKNVADMQAQMVPNGGRSLADRVDAVRTIADNTQSTLHDVRHSVIALGQKQQAALHLNRGALLEFDANGRCTFANRTFLRLTGRTEGEVTGSGWTSCISAEDRRTMLESWGEAVENRSGYETELTLVDTHGNRITGVLQCTGIQADHGMVGWFASFTITRTAQPE